MNHASDILEHNLSALQARQPEVAASIGSCDLPDGVSSAVARDGTPTFLVPCEQGSAWLGGSSMPRASAEEMFGQVAPRGGSVTLPAMLTGMEAIVLAERLAPRFAVFVVDELPAFRLILSLRNYEKHFQAGRIVLLVSDDVPARMRDFFAKNPGFALPAHVFKVPQIEAGQLANLARTLEDAGAQAISMQSEFIATRVNRLRTKVRNVISHAPRIVLLAGDDSHETLELAGRLERGFQTAAVPCETCLPVTSDQCHVAARIATVERSAAEFLLYVNGVGHEERSLFPSQIPVVHWLRPGSCPRIPNIASRFDIVVIESEPSFEMICSAGWPREQAILLEPAADIVTGREVAGVNEKSPIRVVMDLPDDRPEAAGITLPSQLTLWKSLQQEVLRRCDGYDPNDARAILAAAQKSSGTVLTDPSLSAVFESFIKSYIAPATVARTLTLALVKNGFRPEIWGRNWPELGRGQDLRKGTVPSEPNLLHAFEASAWAVIPWFSHAGVQLAVDSMARGNIVVMRGSRDTFATQYPGLAELADSIHWFSAGNELVNLIRGLIAQYEHAAETGRMTARHIQKEHTVARRLQGLIEFVRAHQQRQPYMENP